jgi:Protein of unknown function (DUF2950)
LGLDSDQEKAPSLAPEWHRPTEDRHEYQATSPYIAKANLLLQSTVNSGVMTFMVNHTGTVYQKDLGGRTAIIAKRIYLFDPDQTWKKVDVANP